MKNCIPSLIFAILQPKKLLWHSTNKTALLWLLLNTLPRLSLFFNLSINWMTKFQTCKGVPNVSVTASHNICITTPFSDLTLIQYPLELLIIQSLWAAKVDQAEGAVVRVCSLSVCHQIPTDSGRDWGKVYSLLKRVQ